MATKQGEADQEACVTRADTVHDIEVVNRWPPCVQAFRCDDLSRIPF